MENFNSLIQEEDELYQKYGSPLEAEKKGKFIAISRKGDVLVSGDDIELLSKAIREFGRGSFVFRKIGRKTLGKWR